MRWLQRNHQQNRAPLELGDGPRGERRDAFAQVRDPFSPLRGPKTKSRISLSLKLRLTRDSPPVEAIAASQVGWFSSHRGKRNYERKHALPGRIGLACIPTGAEPNTNRSNRRGSENGCFRLKSKPTRRESPGKRWAGTPPRPHTTPTQNPSTPLPETLSKAT